MASSNTAPRLTAWQRDMVTALVGRVPKALVVGHGRRAGYTTLLTVVEDILKWRGPGPMTLWDGAVYDPDDGQIKDPA